MKFLPDTNVISELTKQEPKKKVLDWFEQIDSSALFVSAITLGEINQAIEKLSEGKKRNDLLSWFSRLQESFRTQTLSVDMETALKWGELCASRSIEGLPMPILDGLIAATAYMSGAILVTRNTKHFRNLAIQTLNPLL